MPGACRRLGGGRAPVLALPLRRLRPWPARQVVGGRHAGSLVVAQPASLSVRQRRWRHIAAAEPGQGPTSNDDLDNSIGDDDEEEEDFDLDAIIGAESEEADLNIDEVFDKIGFRQMQSQPNVVEEEEQLFTYPELEKQTITFGDLLRKCGYDDEVLEQYAAVADVEISGVQADSRAVQEGDLYVCVENAHHNGHHFLPDAITNGAAMVLARLIVPGAELALYTDVDPEDPAAAEIFQDDAMYVLADNDAAILEATVEQIEESDARLDAFADAVGLCEVERETVKAENAMRYVSSGLQYNMDHWRDDDEEGVSDDEELTPHPLNVLVPIECPVPVAFAIDPSDFAAVLAAAFYDRPSERMTTVAVTGTAGKTTVAWLMRSVFEQLGQLTGLIGTVEYTIATDRLDLHGDLWRPDEEDTTLQRECSAPFWAAPYEGKYSVPCTTPDSISVQRLMAGMADRGATACAFEASSIALEQGRLEHVDVDVAVYTNLGREHLDYHEEEDVYRNAKSRLFTQLNDPARQRAVINLDDKHAQFMADAASAVPVVTYSFSNPEADVFVKAVKFSIWETDVTINTPMGLIQVITPLIGRPNVYNILACVAASISINVDLKDIVTAIENAEVVPGRYEIIDEGQDFLVMVDAASTPDALNSLVDTVRECSDTRRIILVFGCAGDRDRAKRAYMGEIAHYKADVVVLTNDNPRSEAPEAIIQDIVDGFPDEVTQAFPESVYNHLLDVGRVPQVFEEELLERQGELKRHVIEDRFSAIRAAVAIAQKNDVVLIAGKGHEDFIEYCDVNGQLFKGWFDDRVEARNALSKLQYLAKVPYLVRKSLPFQRK